MLKVLFNNDGSINTLLVGESIQQGNNNTNQVFAAIKDVAVGTYTCSAEFELPNGSLVELVGAADQQDIGDLTNLDGFTISLSESVTYLAGNLKMNLKLIDLQDNVLCTYQATLKVNPTGYQPNDTTITEAQYNSLLQSLNSYLLINDYSYRIANYYTKSEADTKFIDTTEIQNYYTKSEIDSTLGTYYYTKSETDTFLSGKQNTLTAGSGIVILPDGTISANPEIILSGPYADLATLQAQVPVGASNTIYLVTDPNAVPNNQYDEYIWTSGGYEKIASIDTALNLSEYQKKYSADSTQWDTNPTQNSTKPVTSGGVFSALSGKQDSLTFDNTPTQNSDNPVKSGGVYNEIIKKINYYEINANNQTLSQLYAGASVDNPIGKVFYICDITDPTAPSTYECEFSSQTYGVVHYFLTFSRTDLKRTYTIDITDYSSQNLHDTLTSQTNCTEVNFESTPTQNSKKFITSGGVYNLFDSTAQTESSQSPSSLASRTYPIQRDSNGKGVVNVPWTASGLYEHRIVITETGGNKVKLVYHDSSSTAKTYATWSNTSSILAKGFVNGWFYNGTNYYPLTPNFYFDMFSNPVITYFNGTTEASYTVSETNVSTFVDTVDAL